MKHNHQSEVEARQEEWAGGHHTSSNGKTTKLTELPTPYLQNIVNKYGGTHDVSSIESVLKSREQQ